MKRLPRTRLKFNTMEDIITDLVMILIGYIALLLEIYGDKRHNIHDMAVSLGNYILILTGIIGFIRLIYHLYNLIF